MTNQNANSGGENAKGKLSPGLALTHLALRQLVAWLLAPVWPPPPVVRSALQTVAVEVDGEWRSVRLTLPVKGGAIGGPAGGGHGGGGCDPPRDP